MQSTKEEKKMRPSLLINNKGNNKIPQSKVKSHSKKYVQNSNEPVLKIHYELPIELLKLQTVLSNFKIELLKKDLKTIEKVLQLKPIFFSETYKHLFSSFYYQLQLNAGIIPHHWNMIIGTVQNL